MTTIFKILHIVAMPIMALFGLAVFVVVKIVEPDRSFREFWGA